MSSSISMDIVEVAKSSGLPASTLRYYEDKGLIQSVGRKGLRRLFAPQVLEQLEFIALGQQAGFSLEELMAMFSKEGHFHIDRQQLSLKADELDLRIKQLSAISNTLRHAADCPVEHHRDCPTFQRLLRVAGKHQAKVRHKQ